MDAIELATDKLSIKNGIISYAGIDYKDSEEALILCLDHAITLDLVINEGLEKDIEILDQIVLELSKFEISN